MLTNENIKIIIHHSCRDIAPDKDEACHMAICRVLLGNVHVTEDEKWPSYGNFDSIEVQRPDEDSPSDFIVADESYVYPELVIRYKRID